MKTPEIEMDDLYAINAAKSEFRECFNLADTSRMLAIADPDLVNFSDGQPSEFGEGGLDALKTRLANLFVAEIAMWISGGETKRGIGSCGCTWITRTSLIRFGRNKLHWPGRSSGKFLKLFI